MEQSVPKRQGK